MKQKEWRSAIRNLPKGLSVHEVARRLGKNYAVTHLWLRKFGYAYADGRSVRSPSWVHPDRKIDPSNINWRLSNSVLAKKHGVSRQRIHQLRKQRA